jgi:hypothetical protein
MNKKLIQEYATADIEFAVLLLYFDIKLLHTRKELSKTIFIFEDTTELQELKTKYINDTLQVSPRKFLALLRQTKGLFVHN